MSWWDDVDNAAARKSAEGGTITVPEVVDLLRASSVESITQRDCHYLAVMTSQGDIIVDELTRAGISVGAPIGEGAV